MINKTKKLPINSITIDRNKIVNLRLKRPFLAMFSEKGKDKGHLKRGRNRNFKNIYYLKK